MKLRAIIIAGIFLNLPLNQSYASSADRNAITFPGMNQSESADEAVRADLVKAVDELQPDKRIRIDAGSIGRIEGEYYGFSDNQVMLRLKEGNVFVPQNIPIESVQTLWIQRQYKLLGTLLGGLGGAMLGAGLGSTTEDQTDSWFFDERDASIIYGGIFGLVTGSVAGLVVGSLIKNYVQKYP